MDPDPASLFSLFIAIDFSVALGYLLLFLLLFCSALISGAEVALFSLSKSDVEADLEAKSKPIQIILQLLERPKKLLATILVANNFINIAVVILFAFLSTSLFGGVTNPILKFTLDVIIVTFLILLFGEILPKIYASRNNLKFAIFMATR